MKPLGIKAKVALATSLTSIAMIAVVTMVQVKHMRDDFTQVLLSQQTALIERTADELDDKLAMLLDIITQTARHQPASLMADTAQLREYYKQRAMLALFDDVLVLDTQGKVVANVPEVPGRNGVDVADRAYFQTVMRTKQAMITEPMLGKTSHLPIVQMVAPVLDSNGEVAGIVIGVLRLYKDNMLGHLRTAKVGKSGYYFILTREAVPRYVLYPDASRLLQPRAPNANPVTTQLLKEDGEGSRVSTNSRGVTAVNSFKRLKSVNCCWPPRCPWPMRSSPSMACCTGWCCGVSAPRCWPPPCWPGSRCACCRRWCACAIPCWRCATMASASRRCRSSSAMKLAN